MREIQRGLRPGERARQRVGAADRGGQSLRPASLRSEPRRKDAAGCRAVTLCHSKTVRYSKPVREFGHLVTSLRGCFRRLWNHYKGELLWRKPVTSCLLSGLPVCRQSVISHLTLLSSSLSHHDELHRFKRSRERPPP